MKQQVSNAKKDTSRTRQNASKVGIQIPNKQLHLPIIEQEQTDTM